MPTSYAMTLLLRDPADAPSTRPTFVDVWRRLDENSDVDDVWIFISVRSWFTGVLRDLSRVEAGGQALDKRCWPAGLNSS